MSVGILNWGLFIRKDKTRDKFRIWSPGHTTTLSTYLVKEEQVHFTYTLLTCTIKKTCFLSSVPFTTVSHTVSRAVPVWSRAASLDYWYPWTTTMPHHTCGCSVNSPHNHVCGPRVVPCGILVRIRYHTCGCVENSPHYHTLG